MYDCPLTDLELEKVENLNQMIYVDVYFELYLVCILQIN
jgi:hypothetical protein